MGWYTAIVITCAVSDEDKLDAINAYFRPAERAAQDKKAAAFGSIDLVAPNPPRHHPQFEMFACVFKSGTDDGTPDGVVPGTPGWEGFLKHLRECVPWQLPGDVRVLVHDEHDCGCTLYKLDGTIAGKADEE